MSDIYILAPLAPIQARLRLVKITKILLKNGYNVKFRGWERSVGEACINRWGGDVEEKVILRRGGNGRRSRLMYPVWMITVFTWVLLFGWKKRLYCLGWETAFPAQIAGLITRSTIIFDDADRFSLIVKMPKLISSFVQTLEKWTSKRAFIHIIPTFSRYQWEYPQMVELKNTPLLSDYIGNKDIDIVDKIDLECDVSDSKLTIYINGWLSETRGAPIFKRVLEDINPEALRKINIYYAGPIRESDISAHMLAKHPSVKYFGLLSSEQALQLYRKSDLVLTYYDPSVEINKFAESNKWGDCVFFGVPFVVNNEVLTASSFIESGAAFSFAYNDHDGLKRFLEDLVSDTRRLSEAKSSMIKMQTSYPYFDSAFENRVLSLLS